MSTNDKMKNKHKQYCTVVIVSHFNKKIQETEVKLTPLTHMYRTKVNVIIPPLIERGLYYTPTHREGTILQSLCLSVRLSVCPSVHTFVTDISASTGRNDFIFDIWLWHGDLYRVSPFQVYCTSTSCLPCDLRIFHLFTSFSGNEC